MATSKKDDDNLTKAQQEAAGVEQPEPSDAQIKQAEEDAKQRAENPDEAVGREANPEFGGESFGYGGKPEEK